MIAASKPIAVWFVLSLRPQCGHIAALLETSRPQSGHGMRAKSGSARGRRITDSAKTRSFRGWGYWVVAAPVDAGESYLPPSGPVGPVRKPLSSSGADVDAATKARRVGEKAGEGS